MWFWKRESCGDNERTWLLEIQAEGEINKQHRGLLGHETAWIPWKNCDGLLWVSTRWIWNALRFKPLGRCVCECVPRKNWQREGDTPVECLIDTSWRVAGDTYISRRSRKRQLGLLVAPTLCRSPDSLSLFLYLLHQHLSLISAFRDVQRTKSSPSILQCQTGAPEASGFLNCVATGFPASPVCR